MDPERIEFDDDALTRYFTAANEPLGPDEFAARVLRRARHRARLRQAVLAAAVAIALLLAFEPMLVTLQDFARLLLAFADEWRDAAWYRENALVVGTAIAMTGWPFLARWLAR